MLRFVVALAMIGVLGSVAHAQAPISIGVTAGINISTQDFDIQTDTNRTTRTGLIICGQTDWPLKGPLVLQDRLYYIQKGVTADRSNLLTGPYTVSTELNYIELSLAPKYKIGLNDFKPYVFLGPRLGVLLSGNLVTTRGNTSTTEDVRTNYQSLDFGLDMGAGFAFPIVSKVYFVGDVDYSPGLTNLQKTEIAGARSAFSRDLKVQAGFMLEIYNLSER